MSEKNENEKELEAACSECGNDLEIIDNGDGFLRIHPCSRCLDDTFSRGFHEGKQQGSRPLRFV